MNMFEQASRKKLRFSSPKGDLTTEQLWDLPLTSTNAFNLDQIARGVNSELKGVTEESFVAIKPDPRKPDLELKLEILKHIIAVKLKAQHDAAAAAERSAELKKLTEVLASKEEAALSSMSKDDILKRIAELQAS
jgi:hypothetical protein